MKLPEYQPDGSLPQLPEEPVLGTDLERRYGISKAAFHKRRAVVPSVQGIRRGRFVYFPPEEVYLLDAVHFYLRQNFSLEDIQAAYQHGESGLNEAIEIEATSSSSDLATVSPSMREFSDTMAKHIASALEKYAQPPADPLRTHRLLEEASEKRYEITSKMLANILGMKMNTVHSFGSQELRHGFEITKSGPGKWRIRRLTDEELEAA